MLFNLFMALGIISLFLMIGLLIMVPFKKTFRTKKTFIKIAFCLGGCILFFQVASMIDDHETLKEEYEWSSKWSSVDQAKQSIENTSWTFYEDIREGANYDRWCRLKFKNGKLYFYEVSPAKGEWGNPEICDYIVEERRYSDTGRKYVCITWHTYLMDYMLIPAYDELSYQTNRGYVHAAFLYRRDNDNPWKNK